MLKAYTRVQARLNSLRSEETGATAVEYGLIVAGIAAVIIAAVFLLGDFVGGAFDLVNENLEGNVTPRS